MRTECHVRIEMQMFSKTVNLLNPAVVSLKTSRTKKFFFAFYRIERQLIYMEQAWTIFRVQLNGLDIYSADSRLQNAKEGDFLNFLFIPTGRKNQSRFMRLIDVLFHIIEQGSIVQLEMSICSDFKRLFCSAEFSSISFFSLY